MKFIFKLPTSLYVFLGFCIFLYFPTLQRYDDAVINTVLLSSLFK